MEEYVEGKIRKVIGCRERRRKCRGGSGGRWVGEGWIRVAGKDEDGGEEVEECVEGNARKAAGNGEEGGEEEVEEG